ncbi:MAG: nucleotide exchange factor GrpE [Clostridia bacterium]|nr:nucleotide exchange factor GrpE [Clostridia bacterium]
MTDEEKKASEDAEAETKEEKSEKADAGKAEKKGRKEKAQEKKLEKELAALEKELAELKDSHLRLAAEYENFKKRTAREKEELYFAAKCDVLKRLLPVFDNLERAGAAKGEALEEGVRMILSSFKETLAGIDVHEIEAEGQTFDPAFCEAVFHEEDPEKGENEVTQVLQKGYICGEKVIRHAMVKVAN